MSEVLHADIFFFITGIAVIIFTALVCVVLVHVIKLIASIRRIVARIERGTEALSEDMHALRMHMTGGGAVRKFLHFLFAQPSEEDEDAENESHPKSKGSERKRSSLRVKDES